MEVNFEVRYLKEVIQKHIPKLPSHAKQQIKKAIEEKLAVNPIEFGKPLQYSLRNHGRLRVGDYRIVFRMEQQTKTVVIIAIMHRKDIYKEI